MRPGEAPVLEILTQPSVNETAIQLMMCCGRKEQKMLQSVSATGEEGIVESKRASCLCSALSRHMDSVLQMKIPKSTD